MKFPLSFLRSTKFRMAEIHSFQSQSSLFLRRVPLSERDHAFFATTPSPSNGNHYESSTNNHSTLINTRFLFLRLLTIVGFYKVLKGLNQDEQLAIARADSSNNSKKNTFFEKTAVKPKQERLFVRIIKEIAKEQGLLCETFSGGWIIILRNPKTEETRYIYGPIFSLNSQAQSELCKDKSALSDVLGREGVARVEHRLFLSPYMQDWTSSTGVFKDMFEYTREYNFNVVLKPKGGQGGIDVFHCKNQRDVERAAVFIFSKSPSLVICPYEEIQDEYRVIMLDTEPRLIFKKNRPSLIGDGKRTIRELLVEKVSQVPTEVDNLLHTENISKNFDLNRIPREGEIISVIWKHNLAWGAKASIEINDTERQDILKLATTAAKTIGVRFAAVDIIKNADGSIKIMEINTAIMIEKAELTFANADEIVKSIYSDAVRKMFGDNTPSLDLSKEEDSSKFVTEMKKK